MPVLLLNIIGSNVARATGIAGGRTRGAQLTREMARNSNPRAFRVWIGMDAG